MAPVTVIRPSWVNPAGQGFRRRQAAQDTVLPRPAAARAQTDRQLKGAGNGVFPRMKRGPATLAGMGALLSGQVRRAIALIAHDNKKSDLIEWARFNRALLAEHDLCATGTTGRLLMSELALPVTCLRSGPLGGDQQIGARIADGQIDILIFFWDPLEPHPHDPDVKALLRLAVAWNIPVACNRASADYVISSPLFSHRYDRLQPDFASHVNRGWPVVAASADQLA
jgi:methylglyoxal synthase